MSMEALSVSEKSFEIAPPGTVQGVEGCMRLFQVASPALAGLPVLLVPAPSPQPSRTRRRSKTEATPPPPGTVTTFMVRATDWITALEGIWFATSKRTRARLEKPLPFTPETRLELAPRSLSGKFAKRLVSAFG